MDLSELRVRESSSARGELEEGPHSGHAPQEKKKKSSVLMNPTRSVLVQHLGVHPRCTPGQAPSYLIWDTLLSVVNSFHAVPKQWPTALIIPWVALLNAAV